MSRQMLNISCSCVDVDDGDADAKAANNSDRILVDEALNGVWINSLTYTYIHSNIYSVSYNLQNFTGYLFKSYYNVSE